MVSSCSHNIHLNQTLISFCQISPFEDSVGRSWRPTLKADWKDSNKINNRLLSQIWPHLPQFTNFRPIFYKNLGENLYLIMIRSSAEIGRTNLAHFLWFCYCIWLSYLLASSVSHRFFPPESSNWNTWQNFFLSGLFIVWFKWMLWLHDGTIISDCSSGRPIPVSPGFGLYLYLVVL